jgi:hypothetical protein
MTYHSKHFGHRRHAWRDALHTNDPMDTGRVVDHVLNGLQAGYDAAPQHLVGWVESDPTEYLGLPGGRWWLIECFGPFSLSLRADGWTSPVLVRLAVTQDVAGDVIWSVVLGPPMTAGRYRGAQEYGATPVQDDAAAHGGSFTYDADGDSEPYPWHELDGKSALIGSPDHVAKWTRNVTVPSTLGGGSVAAEYVECCIYVFANPPSGVTPKLVAMHARQYQHDSVTYT